MAKERLNEQWLHDNGYVFNAETNEWARPKKKAEPVLINNKHLRTLQLREPLKERMLPEEDIVRAKVKKKKKKRKTIYTIQDSCLLNADLNGCAITLRGLSPGANVLMRKHWRFRDDLLEDYSARIKALPVMSFHSNKKVNIFFVRHVCDTFMDWDNFYSSFKVPGDALVKTGVLVDDAPEYVKSLTGDQFHCDKRSEERMEIYISYAE